VANFIAKNPSLEPDLVPNVPIRPKFTDLILSDPDPQYTGETGFQNDLRIDKYKFFF
jgi:hypothetical protein